MKLQAIQDMMVIKEDEKKLIRKLILIGLLKKANYNAKISEVENKIPSISGLATNAALAAVENKIPDVSSLVKKTDYNTKVPSK